MLHCNYKKSLKSTKYLYTKSKECILLDFLVIQLNVRSIYLKPELYIVYMCTYKTNSILPLVVYVLYLNSE